LEVRGHLHASSALTAWRKALVSIGQEAGWAIEPVWTKWRGEKSYPSVLIIKQQRVRRCNFKIEWNSFGKEDRHLMMAVYGRNM
jgi:hypothetical protein